MDSGKCWRHLRRPITSLVVALGLSVTGPAWSQAGPAEIPGADAGSDAGAIALLDAFVAEVRDLCAAFEQHRFGEDGEPVEELSTGRFCLLRPDRFRWHYEAPDELIIVADGEWIWYYEVLFEQVDQRPASELAESPAMLLSGAETIRDNYSITELPPAADGKRWLELTPLDPDSNEFVAARLGFVDSVPVVLEFVDGLNELTRVAFADIEINSGLTDDDFEFVPPRGVEIVGVDD